MTHYSRHEIVFVLLLAGAAGAGLAVDHWRRGAPEAVERLERLDRANASVTGVVSRTRSARPPAPPKTREATSAGPLDVNRASAPELERLPGVGRVLAARIVAARPFATLDDLAHVRGLRRATLERLRPRLQPLP